MDIFSILMLIGLGMFYFWRWFLKKIITNERKRKNYTWAATLILTPTIYFGFVYLLLSHITYSPRRDFNRRLWLTETGVRFQMADDIINNPGGPRTTNKNWYYDMGWGGGGLGFLYHELQLKLDSEGKVASVDHIEIMD